MAPGQEVSLQPPLTKVLAQHFHDAAARREVVIARDRLRDPLPVRGLEHCVEPVGVGLVRTEQTKRARLLIEPNDIAQEVSQHPGVLSVTLSGMRHRHRVFTELRHAQVAQQQAAVGVRIGAHAPLCPGRQSGELCAQPTGAVEELCGAIAAHPVLELPQVRRVAADLRQRHLVGPERTLDGLSVHRLRPGPAFGRAQNDHGPAW